VYWTILEESQRGKEPRPAVIKELIKGKGGSNKKGWLKIKLKRIKERKVPEEGIGYPLSLQIER